MATRSGVGVPALALAMLDAAMSPPRGYVYLIHFDRPYKHAAHYTGWTQDLFGRLEDHAAGRGARLMAVIAAEGIGWTLAYTRVGTRADERRQKRRGGAARGCPMCGGRPVAQLVDDLDDTDVTAYV